jgi:alpha-1,4-digalacturonate transport system substrate-binding protein
MRRIRSSFIALAAMASFSTAAHAQTELRMMWYSDGNEGEVIQDLLTRFEQENPDIKVVLDNVAYDVIQTTLPVQLESGQGPDLARVTNIKALSNHWLDLRPHLQDAAYWETNFADYLDWMRPDGSDAIPGFMTQLTVTGPYINKTLFDQAGVEMPADGATWDEWVEAAKQVAASQGVPIALGWDRSGHRLAGPAISFGAKYIGEDGLPDVVDDGFKEMASRIARWHEEGTMPKEVWGGVAGQTYAALNEEFANANVVMYESGSWQIGQFAATIGDAFDWWAVPAPCGPAACSGLPGGAAVVAITYTEHPAEVARVMEWLASEPIMKEFAERTLFIPGHAGLASAGLDFQTDNESAKRALDVFVAETAKFAPVAKLLPAYQWSDAIYAATITRMGQVVAGEITLEEAYERIPEDIDQKIAEATQQ